MRRASASDQKAFCAATAFAAVDVNTATREQLEAFRGFGGAQSYPSRTKDRIPVGEDGYRYRPVLTLKFSKVHELTACAWEHMDNLQYPFAWHATLDLDAVTDAVKMPIKPSFKRVSRRRTAALVARSIV